MDYSLPRWVVLWSPAQNAFHVSTDHEMLKDNRDVFENERDGDFIVLSYAKSQEDAHKICERVQERRNDRAQDGDAKPDYAPS